MKVAAKIKQAKISQEERMDDAKCAGKFNYFYPN